MLVSILFKVYSIIKAFSLQSIYTPIVRDSIVINNIGYRNTPIGYYQIVLSKSTQALKLPFLFVGLKKFKYRNESSRGQASYLFSSFEESTYT